ncbi:MAG: hypothetical protein FJ267_04545 [Planctomycetes bacterium]|nr:hypothetical protein [Planctomycetota bacterium]
MKFNPYESPNEEREDSQVVRKLPTGRTVYKIGVLLVLVGLGVIVGKGPSFGRSKPENGMFDSIIVGFDFLALIIIGAGCIALIASHWFPEARRKSIWKRDK